ncbi:MAG: phosphatase domain-containing protein [Chloroflexota bacterium]
MSPITHDPPPDIDWVPDTDLRDGRPGRIGMTVLPGKQGPSLRYPGRVYRADLDADLVALGRVGIHRLLLLVVDEELARWSDLAIVERGARLGIDIERHPIPDGSPPTSIAAMDAILASLAEARSVSNAAGACMGGVGRTGTVAACALVVAGWEPDAAIARVRDIRHPTAVETPSQVQFVRTYWVERCQ